MVQNPATSSLAGEETWAIAEDSSGTMWFGTRHNGIYAFSVSGSRHLTVANGLPSDEICGLIVDRSGELWASSLDQIFSIPVSRAASKLDEGDFAVPRSYILPSGTEGLRFTRGRIPNALLDSHGTVWFASDHGVAFIDNSTNLRDEISDEPTPIIRSVLIDNSFLPVSAQIKTRPNPRQVVISFGADYLSPGQEMLMMYRLKGVDVGWTISTNPQQAEYSNLSAGSYWFELRACDRAQPERWRTTTYQIMVPVIWYRSPWFSVSLALMCLTVVFVAYLMHLRRLRYGFRLILEERSRVSREMHDTLIQGCNGVAMLLEAESSSRGESGESTFLNLARTQLRETVCSARDALWNLRQSEADSSYIQRTLESIAAHASSTFGIPVDVRYQVRHSCLPASVAHQLMMIVREAVINAGTHGSPRRIIISAQGSSKQFSIEVADNGVGFDEGELSVPAIDHYGIQGMRERADAIGALLDINSTPGLGTAVRVFLSNNGSSH
jgi:signal transduction histidine kinase